MTDKLLGRLWAAVNPTDVIDQVFVKEFAGLEWEVMRLRRMKTSLIRMWGLEALKGWLRDALDEDRCSDQFGELLTNTLQQGDLSEDRAQTLAEEFVRDDQNAVDEVRGLLEGMRVDLEDIYRAARENEAAELVRNYATSRPDAVSEIRELLANDAKTMDDMWSQAFADTESLLAIERIDRLTMLAEDRRNASLHISLSRGISHFRSCYFILLFDSQTFFRPDRTSPPPSRAARVKDGACSAPPKACP